MCVFFIHAFNLVHAFILVDEYENLDLIMQGLIPLFMTCRSSGQEKEDGLHCMGKGFLSRMILHCLMKKSGTIIWQYAMSLQIFLAEGKSLHM